MTKNKNEIKISYIELNKMVHNVMDVLMGFNKITEAKNHLSNIKDELINTYAQDGNRTVSMASQLQWFLTMRLNSRAFWYRGSKGKTKCKSLVNNFNKLVFS